MKIHFRLSSSVFQSLPSLLLLAVKDFAINLVLDGIIFVFFQVLWNYFQSPFKSFPGPWAASFTNLWRLQDIFRDRWDITDLDLHQKFGSVAYVYDRASALLDT